MTKTTTAKTPTVVDAYLSQFIKRNSHVNIRVEGETLMIESPWGAGNVAIVCDLSDHEFLADLNNVWFNPAFDAIIHLDSDTFEILFLYLDPEDAIHSSYLDRDFKVHLDGNEFHCRFGEPTECLMAIARRTQNVPSDNPGRTVPQIAAFRDAQRIDELPERAKNYFKDRIPRNFHVTCTTDITSVDLVALVNHVNFIVDYYDRNAPEIDVREDAIEDKLHEKRLPLRFISDTFPSELSIGLIDEIVLQLTQVARRAPSRQAFLYYYQVLEYAGHYFVDKRARSQIRRFLRDPALVNCDDRKIGEFFSLLTEVNNNDDVKMKKVIEDLVDPLVVWREIENDRDFFTSELQFDGGFILQPLIAKDTSAETWKNMWMPKLFDQFTRIRNCLVHARERRENRVILPTRRNNRRISRYEPVIARVAQQIALASRQ
jgi:hypothetical protein